MRVMNISKINFSKSSMFFLKLGHFYVIFLSMNSLALINFVITMELSQIFAVFWKKNFQQREKRLIREL